MMILAEGEWSGWTIGGLLVLLFIVIIFLAIVGQFLGLYIRSYFSGAPFSLFELIGMRLRKINAMGIVNSRIQAVRAGLAVTTQEMESHYLAGGDVDRVIRAMIAANKANIDLPWKTATAIDLAGRDILEAIQTSVNPKVIDVPSIAMGRN